MNSSGGQPPSGNGPPWGGGPPGGQPGYGAPAGWQPTQPQQQPWQGQQQQPQQQQQWPGQPTPGQQSVAPIGLFGKVPCPHCGAPTHGGTMGTMGGAVAGRAGGLFGYLLWRAFAGNYHCTTHGPIAMAQLPPQHRSMVVVRKIVMVGGAFAILIGVIIALAFINDD